MNKQPTISEPEVIIINCDEEISPLVSKNGSKSGKRQKNKRKVQIDSTDNTKLTITQKVKKNKFQCIINLTNICKHEDKGRSRLKTIVINRNKKGKEELKRNSILERVLPRCMRKSCQSANCTRRPNRRSNKKESLKHSPKHKKSLSNRILLSPVSSINLSEEISISSDSFTESDNDLETLIKRTRDREKQLMTFSSRSPTHSSSPFEINSEEDNIKCIDSASIHSVATIVLEDRSNLYSPTNPTMSPYSQNYSPTESIGGPNKCDSEHTSPINIELDFVPSTRNITLQNYPVLSDTQVKCEPYFPTTIPTYSECYAIANEVSIKSPKCEVFSATGKSNKQQEISFYSAGTETNIKKEPYSPVKSSNMS